MKDELNTKELRKAAREVRRQLEREQEEVNEKQEQLRLSYLSVEATEAMLAKIDSLEQELEQERQLWQDEKEQLHQQLQEEKDRNTNLEMQLKEMRNLSASVAGKASQEEVLKALRVFVNKSKRKKLEKRIAVKDMVLELANANALVLPEDLASSVDSLDDEQIVEQPTTTVGVVTDEMDELFTPEAEVIWQRLRDAGFIVPDGYGLAEGVSANQAAYIADKMAEKLQIKKKWKLFQQLWGIPNMAQLAGSWQQTGKIPPRSHEIDMIMQ